MKRFLSVFLFLFISLFVFAESVSSDGGRTVFFNGSIGTGTVIYGNKDITNNIDNLVKEGYSRFLLSGDLGLGIAADEHIRFTVGTTLACDFLTKSGGDYSNYLDYSFFCGIRLYPSSTGFNMAAEYVVGRRSDFVSVETKQTVSNTMWGNGFRFLVEYDFKHDSSGFSPIIGGTYRYMPRGSYVDHILAVYFRFTVR